MRTMRDNSVSRHAEWARKNKRYIDKYSEIRKGNDQIPSIESLRREY